MARTLMRLVSTGKNKKGKLTGTTYYTSKIQNAPKIERKKFDPITQKKEKFIEKKMPSPKK